MFVYRQRRERLIFSAVQRGKAVQAPALGADLGHADQGKAVGVRVYPLSAYYTPPVKPPRATLVLGYAGLTEQQIGEAAKLLKQAWTK